MDVDVPSVEDMIATCTALLHYQQHTDTNERSSDDRSRKRRRTETQAKDNHNGSDDDGGDDDGDDDDGDEGGRDDDDDDDDDGGGAEDDENDDEGIMSFEAEAPSATSTSVTPNFDVVLKCVELEMACFLEEAVSHNKEYRDLLQTPSKASTKARNQRNKILEKATEWRLNTINIRFICQLLYSAFKLAKPELDRSGPMAEFLFGVFDSLVGICVEPFTRLTLDGKLPIHVSRNLFTAFLRPPDVAFVGNLAPLLKQFPELIQWFMFGVKPNIVRTAIYLQALLVHNFENRGDFIITVAQNARGMNEVSTTQPYSVPLLPYGTYVHRKSLNTLTL
jgi:hypothetical protein